MAGVLVHDRLLFIRRGGARRDVDCCQVSASQTVYHYSSAWSALDVGQLGVSLIHT